MWTGEKNEKELFNNDEKDFLTRKNKVLTRYSAKEILKQYNILKRIINHSSIPNVLNVRTLIYHNRNGLDLCHQSKIEEGVTV